MLDLHWLRPGTLKKWIVELINYEIFNFLDSKTYSRPKCKLYDLILLRWLEYNKNDLLSTYCLCLYKHNLRKFFYKKIFLFFGFYTAYNQLKNENPNFTLYNAMLYRTSMYLKDSLENKKKYIQHSGYNQL